METHDSAHDELRLAILWLYIELWRTRNDIPVSAVKACIYFTSKYTAQAKWALTTEANP